jgi:hypothetical protein
MGTEATVPKSQSSESKIMKTFIVAYQVAASSERADLLEQLKRHKGFQVFPGLWRLQLGGTTCAALLTNFQRYVPAGTCLYVAEVTDSMEAIGSQMPQGVLEC